MQENIPFHLPQTLTEKEMTCQDTLAEGEKAPMVDGEELCLREKDMTKLGLTLVAEMLCQPMVIVDEKEQHLDDKNQGQDDSGPSKLNRLLVHPTVMITPVG